MTANQDLQRRVARHYETEPPMRAPDWVLQSALSTIESTRQRRGLPALRRYPDLSNYTKLAAAAVVVLAAGGFALWQLGPGNPGDRPLPTSSPTVAPSPTRAPTTRPQPTTYVPGALTQTFTSDLYGISLTYPEGWVAEKATEPWTEADPPIFGLATGDFVYDPALRDHLFLAVVSRPLDGASLDAWLSGFLTAEGCTLTAGDAIDGADRVLRSACDIALASSGGRGYFIALYASADDVELRTLDTATLFEALLATVQLHPEDAVAK
jgi:hypothetical protein